MSLRVSVSPWRTTLRLDIAPTMRLTNSYTTKPRPAEGEDARDAFVRELTPADVAAGLATDLWEIKPGGTSARHSHPEEHSCYVLAGAGEYHGPVGAPVLQLREGAAFYIGPNEEHWVVNTTRTDLKVLVTTPLPQREAPKEKAPADKRRSQLKVVFDGGSRGNPGQGYGSFVIMAPGRQPHLVQREYGDHVTNNEAEYRTLIEALEYIISTLEKTGRATTGVELDIRGDSELLMKQMKGEYKIKSPQLRELADSAHKLLRRFGKWELTWHAREESVALLGH